MTTTATEERHRLADLFADLGPDAPTLCDGWQTQDLAAHLVMRERRPDGAAGVLIGKLAGHADKVQSKIAAQPWTELVDQVRSGPPRWSPTRLGAIDRLANTIEFFVHHEDVRRAQPDWVPRELTAEARDDLASALGRMVRLLARRVPVGLRLEPTDGAEPITAKKGDPVVTLRGPIGELVLYIYGRRDHANVEIDGPDEAVDAVRTADLGI